MAKSTVILVTDLSSLKAHAVVRTDTVHVATLSFAAV